VQVPKEVRVSVPVSCVAPADVPKAPALLSDAELWGFDSYRRTWALWGDRAARRAYIAELEAVALGCSKIPTINGGL
jgi:hypothetical protein